VATGVLFALVPISQGADHSGAFKGNIYQPGPLKPVDSVLKVKVGGPAPPFTLPAVSGEKFL
jgi:peroxiredoxin (alkyl hydroperoxide reductase subunit C)